MQLQKGLEERAKKEENWLSGWWLNAAYLDYRNPVTVWSSPGLVYPMRSFPEKSHMVDFAASLIMAAVDYKLQIDG